MLTSSAVPAKPRTMTTAVACTSSGPRGLRGAPVACIAGQGRVASCCFTCNGKCTHDGQLQRQYRGRAAVERYRQQQAAQRRAEGAPIGSGGCPTYLSTTRPLGVCTWTPRRGRPGSGRWQQGRAHVRNAARSLFVSGWCGPGAWSSHRRNPEHHHGQQHPRIQGRTSRGVSSTCAG